MKDFKWVSKTNLGVIILAIGTILRALGKNDVANITDNLWKSMSPLIPSIVQAIGGIISIIGIGHKHDRTLAALKAIKNGRT